jgi:GntR family transcriptional regulator
VIPVSSAFAQQTHLLVITGVPGDDEHAQMQSMVPVPGDELPPIRALAERLVINPNTVARAYRDLEHEGIIELKHGSGAFICETVVPRERLMQKAHVVVQSTLDKLEAFDLTEDEIRRLVENELAVRLARKPRRKHA